MMQQGRNMCSLNHWLPGHSLSWLEQGPNQQRPHLPQEEEMQLQGPLQSSCQQKSDIKSLVFNDTALTEHDIWATVTTLFIKGWCESYPEPSDRVFTLWLSLFTRYFRILVKLLVSRRHRSVQFISSLSCYKELSWREGTQGHKASGRTKARTQNNSSEIQSWWGKRWSSAGWWA